jgi:hypothetical protein
MMEQQTQIEAGTLVEFWDCPSQQWETGEYVGFDNGWHVVRRANGKKRGCAWIRLDGREIHA